MDLIRHKCSLQLSVESNPRLHCINFTSLHDWPRKLAPLSQPIRCKTKTITTQSPAFSCTLGSLAAFTLRSHWLQRVLSFPLIGRCDYSRITLGVVYDNLLHRPSGALFLPSLFLVFLIVLLINVFHSKAILTHRKKGQTSREAAPSISNNTLRTSHPDLYFTVITLVGTKISRSVSEQLRTYLPPTLTTNNGRQVGQGKGRFAVPRN